MDTVGDHDLDDEIAMLRVVMRRLIESTPEEVAFPDAIKFLRVISIASANLSRLMRARQVIAENTEFEDPLPRVLAQLNAERDSRSAAGGN